MFFKLPRTLRSQQQFEQQRFIKSLTGKDQKGWRKLSDFDALDNDLEFFIASELHGITASGKMGSNPLWCNGAAIENLHQQGKYRFTLEASVWLLPHNTNAPQNGPDYYFLSGYVVLNTTKNAFKEYKLHITNGAHSFTLSKRVF